MDPTPPPPVLPYNVLIVGTIVEWNVGVLSAYTQGVRAFPILKRVVMLKGRMNKHENEQLLAPST